MTPSRPPPSGSARVDWPTAFLATSVLLGEPIDEAVASLGERATAASAELARELSGHAREARARAVAAIVTAVVADLDTGVWG